MITFKLVCEQKWIYWDRKYSKSFTLETESVLQVYISVCREKDTFEMCALMQTCVTSIHTSVARSSEIPSQVVSEWREKKKNTTVMAASVDITWPSQVGHVDNNSRDLSKSKFKPSFTLKSYTAFTIPPSLLTRFVTFELFGGLMTCMQNVSEAGWGLFTVLIKSFLVNWAKRTNYSYHLSWSGTILRSSK